MIIQWYDFNQLFFFHNQMLILFLYTYVSMCIVRTLVIVRMLIINTLGKNIFLIIQIQFVVLFINKNELIFSSLLKYDLLIINSVINLTINIFCINIDIYVLCTCFENASQLTIIILNIMIYNISKNYCYLRQN